MEADEDRVWDIVRARHKKKTRQREQKFITKPKKKRNHAWGSPQLQPLSPRWFAIHTHTHAHSMGRTHTHTQWTMRRMSVSLRPPPAPAATISTLIRAPSLSLQQKQSAKESETNQSEEKTFCTTLCPLQELVLALVLALELELELELSATFLLFINLIKDNEILFRFFWFLRSCRQCESTI